MQIVNCAGLVSKWVGDTPKNIDALFQEARATDAVLCFDEAEGLFGTRSSDMGSSTDRYAAMVVGVRPPPPPPPPPGSKQPKHHVSLHKQFEGGELDMRLCLLV